MSDEKISEEKMADKQMAEDEKISDESNSEESSHASSFTKLKDASSSSLDKNSGWSSDDSDETTLEAIAIFKTETEELQKALSKEFDARFEGIMGRLSAEIKKKKKKKDKHVNEHDSKGDKIFRVRESLLTELFEVNHVQTIYNIFIAFLFVFIINTTIHDYLTSGKGLDISIMFWMFGKKSIVVWTWMQMQFYSLLAYPLFSVFASNQLSRSTRLPLVVWGVGYVIYMTVMSYAPIAVIMHEDLAPAAAAIIVTEQVRFVMKIHAFVRTNTSKVLHHANKLSADKTNTSNVATFHLPGFSQYLYFFFVPTLIYRDHYPRTPYIRWNFVVMNLLQVIGCMFYIFFLFARFIVPVFQNTGNETGNIRTLLITAFTCMLPGMLVLLVAFFAILHSWMNAFAEMTTYADRMFYRDWWNCNSFSSYYRTWNVVVHDWLYAYVYKDLLCLLGGEKSRGFAAISVFWISAIIHEYVIAVMFRFCYPLLLFMFGGVGLAFFFVKPKKGTNHPLWNIYLWVSLTMGSGILMTLYSVEWYASRNCKRELFSFIPYSLDSRCVKWEWK